MIETADINEKQHADLASIIFIIAVFATVSLFIS